MSITPKNVLPEPYYGQVVGPRDERRWNFVQWLQRNPESRLHLEYYSGRLALTDTPSWFFEMPAACGTKAVRQARRETLVTWLRGSNNRWSQYADDPFNPNQRTGEYHVLVEETPEQQTLNLHL